MRDRIVEDTFATLDRCLRKASIARIGGFRPPEDSKTSWFGGGFVAGSDEGWPVLAGKPAIPLLQVRCDELPAIPPQLDGVALFTVFVSSLGAPLDPPASNGDGWVVRLYRSLDGLVPLDVPESASTLRPFPIRWELSVTEAPGWEDAWTVCDLNGFNELPDAGDLFFERYRSHPYTKVGGWPSYIQSATGDADNFVFQIASEEKPQWMLADNGNMYFFCSKNGIWKMHWDCY